MSGLKDYRRLFAWTAIYLIISVTFFTANALASINYRSSGSDFVNEWRKETDTTLFYINASANVSIQVDGDWHKMETCVKQDNTTYICEYFLPEDTVNAAVALTQLRVDSDPPQEVTSTLKIDKFAPEIDYLNITQENGVLNVRYAIRDHAYDGSNNCSGLLDIIVTAGSEGRDPIEFNKTVCYYNGTIPFNEPDFYQEDFPITIIAHDRLHQELKNATTMLLDLQKPDIQDDWQIMKNGQVLETLSNAPENMQVDVVVYIDDPQLDVTRVRADLSSLHTNIVKKNLNKNKIATCVKQSDTLYKCTFSGIYIKPLSENLNISVNAYDKSYNYANETISRTISLQSDPGQVSYVGPLKEHCTTDLNRCFVKTGPQRFITEINTGSSFNNTLINVRIGDGTTFARCFLEDTKWVCTTIQYPVSASGQLLVSLAESYDDYGNQLSYVERMVTVDNVPPKILGNITSDAPNCSLAGDTLELKFTTKEADSTVLRTYVNTSKFTNVDITNGTCENTLNDEWECTLDITGFTSEYSKKIRDITIADLAGNIATKPFTFEVCVQDLNAVPNIITKIEQENDINVDRRTASWLPIKTYVPLKITKNTGTITSMTVDNCFAIDPDDKTNEISVLDSGHYFIDNTMVLYVGFDGATLPEKEFDINCTINARVRVGQKLYLKPEQESFTLKVKPYNNPLGTVDSSVQQKMTQEKAALRDLDSEIKWRDSINGIAMLFCNLAKLVAKINGVLQTLKSVLYVVFVAMASVPFLTAAAEAGWAWYGGALNWFDENVAQQIWPTSILNGAWYGHVLKYTCMLYACEHYKVSGLYTLTSDAVTGINALKMNSIESRAKEVFDKEGTLIDENTFRSKDGTEYKRTIDTDGIETWKGTDGTIMTYDPKSSTWSRESGPSEQWLQKRESEILQKKQVAFEKFKTSKPGVILPNGDYAVGIEVYRYYADPIGTGGSWQLYNVDPSLGFSQVELQTMFPDKITFNKDLTATVDGNPYKWKYDPEVEKYVVELSPSNNGVIGDKKTIEPVQNKNSVNLLPTNTGKLYGEKLVFESKDSESGARQWIYRDNSGAYYTYIDEKGSKVYLYTYRTVNGGSLLVIQNPHNGNGNAILDISGNVINSITGKVGEYTVKTDSEGNIVDAPALGTTASSSSIDFSDINSANQAYFNRNLKFYSALESEDWIVNPYRSTHWDGLCFPAVLYNLEKEKQIRCKYLSCLETQTNAGMPSYVCDREYGMETCLYLDSAQWHVTGGQFWDTVGPGLLKSAFSFAVGMAPYLAHDLLCADYKLRNFKVVAVTELFSFGSKDVLCGLGSGALQINEVVAMGTGDFWENLYGSDVPKDPAEVHDYCEEVDYSE